jgi:hypothetical protein
MRSRRRKKHWNCIYGTWKMTEKSSLPHTDPRAMREPRTDDRAGARQSARDAPASRDHDEPIISVEEIAD